MAKENSKLVTETGNTETLQRENAQLKSKILQLEKRAPASDASSMYRLCFHHSNALLVSTCVVTV